MQIMPAQKLKNLKNRVMIEVKMTVRYQDTLISSGIYVPTGQVFLGNKMYKNINNGQIVSLGNEELKLINKKNETKLVKN